MQTDSLLTMLDFANNDVQIVIEEKKLWINIDGLCRLRLQNREQHTIAVEDKRKGLMLRGTATEHIWGMEDGPKTHPIGIRFDCGDSGVVYLSCSQADDLATMLVNSFGCVIKPK
jgi:hypothetical protein